MGIVDKFKSALSKTASKFAKITDIFTKTKIDASSLEELEEVLLSADFGVKTTNLITEQLVKLKFDKNSDPAAFKEALKNILFDILIPVEAPLNLSTDRLNVILVCGVNGNGKTTSIGKLTYNFINQGKKVYLAACDTFRAAAVEQLQVWGERNNCPVITGAPGSDPASVAFKAYAEAQAAQADILIIDTAGRLQNQHNLMQELAKIINVIKKHDASAPHEVILTLDATTGQNAFSQLEKFNEIAGITGLIITKLDGTAKGGVVLGLAYSFKLPIYFIGTGESIQDLTIFDARAYIEAMLA